MLLATPPKDHSMRPSPRPVTNILTDLSHCLYCPLPIDFRIDAGHVHCRVTKNRFCRLDARNAYAVALQPCDAIGAATGDDRFATA
jgi:hypothetical protein